MQEAKIYNSHLAKSKAYSKDPAPWSELGMIILQEEKNPKKSLSYFNYAYRLAPSNPVTVLNLAVLCDRYLNKKKEAKAFYQRYLVLTRQDSSLAGERASVEKRIQAL
jgi:tetratricopeptide (TPR) repeat protein